MSLLLDTNIAYWWQIEDPYIERGARAAIETELGEVFVSSVSLWELSIKIGTGKLRLDLPKFSAEVERLGFHWLPLSNRQILRLSDLPSFSDHKDPFDRMLIAQARTEHMILLTSDAYLVRYGDFVRAV